MSQKLTKIIAVVMGIIIAILLIIMAFRLLSGAFTRAADVEPRDVVISEISQNTAKISWSTGIETQGVVEYGTSPTALNFFAPEATKTKDHLVELTLLSPTTSYYFQIRIGDKKYDNGGVPWTFTTKGTIIPSPANPTVITTPTPTTPLSTESPTPVQTLEIPITPQLVCDETDCAKIKEKLGKGCSTQDYFRCIRKLTPTATASATTPTP